MTSHRRLASKSAVLFGLRLFGAATAFLTQGAIARFWGADMLGEYVLIIALVNIVATVMPLGFQAIGTYFAAEYLARSDGAMLRSFLRRAYGHIAVVGLFGLAAAPFAASMIGEAHPALQRLWLPILLMALATSVVFVNGALLVGLKHPLAGFLADVLVRPILAFAGFLLATLFGHADHLFLLVWIIAAGSLCVAALHCAFAVSVARRVSSDVAPRRAEARSAERRRWWRVAVPWVIIALATDFFFDVDLLLLSGLMSREELAVFGVCTRVFALAAFGVAVVYSVTMPELFEAEALNDRPAFLRRIGEANIVAAALAVAISAAVLIVGPVFLRAFGEEFSSGAVPLALLCGGLAIRAILGPASLVLSIYDRPYASLPSIALALIALYGGNLVLVPAYGLVGAALAALGAMILWSASLWLIALRTMNVDTSILPFLRQAIVKP